MKGGATIDHLLDIASAASPAEVPAAALAWLQGCVQRLEAGEEPATAFDLARVGQTLRRRRKLHHLRRAADLIPVTGAWPKAKLLAAEIKAFRRRKWPANRDSHVPPPGFCDLDRELFALLKSSHGAAVPESPTRIYALLSESECFE